VSMRVEKLSRCVMLRLMVTISVFIGGSIFGIVSERDERPYRTICMPLFTAWPAARFLASVQELCGFAA
jgi:hypothetical protein